jgi:hypothetical protein
MSSQHNDDVRTIRWSDGRCEVQVRIEGEVTFNEDFTAIASVTRGGLVRIEEDNGQVERRVDVRPGAGGLEYSYRVDGREAAFDAAGRSWLSGMVVELLRSTGLAAQERVAWMVRRAGPEGVLREIPVLRGDWVKRQYLQALLTGSRLEPAQVQRVLQTADQTLTSDYERAELLIAVAKAYALDAASKDAYLAAQRAIRSDYEQRRVLSAVLAQGRLTPAQLAGVLDAATTLDSDYERAELLLQLTAEDLSAAEAQEAFLRAAGGIGSDYEKRRVLATLLKREKLGAEQMAFLVRSAKTIESDYEMAELLLQVAAQGPVEGALRDGVMEALDTIGSSYEYGRVASALLRQGSGRR